MVVAFALMLAINSLSILAFASPVTKFLYRPLPERQSGIYTVYSGSGEVSDGWPALDDWVLDFNTMFNDNMATIHQSCVQFGVPSNSDDEISTMARSIQSVAISATVDPRFIFAIILQESNGCVRVPTTYSTHRNPGLMQSHDGEGTCNSNSSVPCVSSNITQMIKDGTIGTSSGDGLKQNLEEASVSDVSQYYRAARIYNSGSIHQSGNLGRGSSTHCYVSDIANRLTGWSSGVSGCNANSIGDLNGSSSNGNNAKANFICHPLNRQIPQIDRLTVFRAKSLQLSPQHQLHGLPLPLG